jgi:uncharacterized protein YegJ (DUF2314 family)
MYLAFLSTFEIDDLEKNQLKIDQDNCDRTMHFWILWVTFSVFLFIKNF